MESEVCTAAHGFLLMGDKMRMKWNLMWESFYWWNFVQRMHTLRGLGDDTAFWL